MKMNDDNTDQAQSDCAELHLRAQVDRLEAARERAESAAALAREAQSAAAAALEAERARRDLLERRVVAFAGQLTAWGYAKAAANLQQEILEGPVNAPDYAALLAELVAARALIATFDEVAAGETSMSALRIARARYEDAVKARDE